MVNLALIGLGDWGKNYLSTIKSFPNCQIKYVCAKTTNKLTLLGNNFIKTKNYRELFKYQDIDGVIIATPGSTHYQIAKDFLERGFNLLIEKPLTENYQDALKLKKIHDRTTSKVLIGHIYLFDPAYIKCKKLLARIGAIKYISYEALSNRSYSYPVSLLWEYGPHPISLLLDIYGQDPLKIQALTKPSNKNEIVLKLEFLDQSESIIKLSWSPFKKRELIIAGSKGKLIYNDLKPNRLTLIETVDTKNKKTLPSYNHKLPLEKELKEFVEAISENKNIVRSNLDFGVRVTKLLELAEESMRRVK